VYVPVVNATFDAFLRSWPFDPWIVVPLLLTARFYVRGWLVLRRRGARRFDRFQLISFLGGLLALFLALASPIEPFASLLLLVHMLQHLLLMMVAPPLLWLGEPLLPILCGLPAPVRRVWVAPFLRLRPVRRLLTWLTHPARALIFFVVATWFWHLPRFYEMALQADVWHAVEHGCFLATGMLFWWPVVEPYPGRLRWSRWLLLPYLFLADVQNTALSALFAFSDRVIYPHYAAMPRLWRLSPLTDQCIAGALMWVPGSVAFLGPLVVITLRLLSGNKRRAGGSVADSLRESAVVSRSATTTQARGNRIPLPLVTSQPRSWDVLRLPLLGRFLRWRHARLALQVPLFLIAAAIVADGLWGPPVAGLNLAGVIPWIHWRGLLVLGLLVAGNVFCMGCPFLLPRSLARMALPAEWAWPRRLRSKWLAVALLVLFFWAYEAFSLWASPWWTAAIVVGYFLGAFAVDGLFRGASFCKYVCPIGQFNFVQSLMSPLEVRVRDPEVCDACKTKDCIRGRDGIPGCELHLFLPRKASNVDCTLCLDCIHACPHENIGIEAVIPAAELWRDPQRSGIGRFGHRPDLAALVVVLTFAAFVNAAGMVAPVVQTQNRLSWALGLRGAWWGWVMTGCMLMSLLVLPLLLVGGAAVVGRWWSGDPGFWRDVATRFAFALLPLGFGMWLAHYSFHFLTGIGTVLPVTQRAAADLGVAWLGEPTWALSGSIAGAGLLRLELLFLDGGLLLSLYTAWRIALERRPRMGQALRAFLPWAVVLVLLFAVGVWIVFQPMEMRGMMSMG
jgi:cytochrome c oxidase assembly factor CtaG/ferredoxin